MRGVGMKKRCVVCSFCNILILVCCFISCGCATHLYKNYDYLTSEIKNDVFLVGAKLIGSFHSKENYTLKASPYELLVWVEPKHDGGTSITIVELKLLDHEKHVIFSSQEPKTQVASTGQYDRNTAYFSYNGLDLPFSNYEILLTLRLNNDNAIERDVNIECRMNYTEERSSKIWDKIMSI
jgi:hypothetical protein